MVMSKVDTNFINNTYTGIIIGFCKVTVVQLICAVARFPLRSLQISLFCFAIFSHELNKSIYYITSISILDLCAGRDNKCGLRDPQPAGSCGSKDLNILWCGAGAG